MGRKPKSRRNSAPVAVGTGLIALDVVFSEGVISPLGRWAGGTCGNVLTILSFLGWDSFPIGRFKKNEEADLIVKDLKHWKVRTDLISYDDTATTPVVIEYIRRQPKNGTTHRFSLRCPICGNHLPGYRSITLRTVPSVTEKVKKTDVFFFDRVSPAALSLAKTYSQQGAVVYFEPIGIGDERLFRKALSVSHIVKYSSDMLAGMPKGIDFPPLLIETRGKEGIRFRARLPRVKSRQWEYVDGFTVESIKDAAGAGDWFTAGIISQLAVGGCSHLKAATRNDVSDALTLSQAFAAWSCTFESPRKGMYGLSHDGFRKRIAQVRQAGAPDITSSASQSRLSKASFRSHLCLSCRIE